MPQSTENCPPDEKASKLVPVIHSGSDKAARIQALEKVLGTLQVAEKDEGIEALRVSLLAQLNTVWETVQADQPAAGQVEALRKALRVEIMPRETAKSKAFFDNVFQIQVMLTEQWPGNRFDEKGSPEDPIFFDSIPVKKRVAGVTSYYIFNRDSLNNYYSRANAYKENKATNAIEVRDILCGEAVISEREVAHFIKNGVGILPRDNNLRDQMGWAHALGEGGRPVQVGNALARLNASAVLSGIRFILAADMPLVFKVLLFGGFAGYFAGFIVACGIVLVAALSTANPVSLMVIGGIGLVCGLVHSRRNPGVATFLDGFLYGCMGGVVLCSFTVLGPMLIAALSVSLISSAAATTLLAGYTVIQPFIPALLGLPAVIYEYSHPDALYRFFKGIGDIVLTIPSLVGTAVGVIASAIVCAGGYLLYAGVSGVVSRFTRPRPPFEIQPQQPRGALSLNAQVQDLFGEPVSPGRQAALHIAAADNGGDWETAVLVQQQLFESNAPTDWPRSGSTGLRR